MPKMTSPAQAIDSDIFQDSDVQQMDLGTKVVAADGREYRYVKAGGTALVAGKVYDGPANSTDFANISVASAAAAGATSITVTLGSTAATANQFAGGVVVVNDVDGQGFTYTIDSHPAADASASLVLTLHPDEPVVTALTTSSQVTLIPNQYNGVIIHAATETGIPVGVAVQNITASQYGFIQTRGPVSALCDANVAALGQQVDASTTTDGSVTLGTVATAGIGYALAQGVSTEYNPIFLNIG